MKRIIIVEDEALIAEEIAGTLESLGYEVVGNEVNGDKALDVFANTPADLILLDINIRGTIDGIGLAKIIREKYKLPFVFLTSFSDAPTLEKVKETIPYGYIVKPFSDDDLRINIELALAKFDSENKTLDREKLMQQYSIQLGNSEFKVLNELMDGLSYKNIASKQFMSINTVKAHQKKLYAKFGVSSRAELMNKLNRQ